MPAPQVPLHARTVQLTEIPTRPQLTGDQWAAVVDAWNGLLPQERSARARHCRTMGTHDLVSCPVAPRFCRRCVSYFDDH